MSGGPYGPREPRLTARAYASVFYDPWEQVFRFRLPDGTVSPPQRDEETARAAALLTYNAIGEKN